MIPGDILIAFPHRQFHTLPSLLDSWAALPNSNPNACVPMQGGSLYHFYDGLWYDLAERRTHDLPCETTYMLPTEPTRHRITHTHTHIHIRGKKITCPGARDKLNFRQDKHIFSPNVRRTSKNSVQAFLTKYFGQVN